MADNDYLSALKSPYVVAQQDPDGNTIYIDPATGEQVTDLTGLTVLDGNQFYQVTQDDDQNHDGSVSPREVRQRPTDSRSASEMGGPRYNGTPTSKDSKYIDKPGWMGLTGLAPGPLGMLGKVANLAWNANNIQAANNKKTELGQKTLGFKDTVKGLVKGVNEDGTTSKKSGLLSKITGLQPGWAKEALNHVFGKEDKATENQSTPGTGVASTNTSTPTQSSPADSSGVGFMSHFGPNRPNMPSANIVDAVRSEVGKTFGKGYSVLGISGQEDPGEQYGSTRHKTGLAMDFDVVDPSGRRVTDTNKLNDMAAAFAKDNPTAGIGFGQGYMAPGRMHLDITGQGKQWGAANTVANMDPALNESIDAARQGYTSTPFSNPGVPSNRPDPNAQRSFVSQDERVGPDLDPMSHQSVLAAGPKANVAQQTTANSLADAKLGTSPAARAAMGLTNRSPIEKQAMAMTIAGEMSPTSLAGLKNRDPAALAEFGSMVATMENRAQSVSYKGMESAVTAPSQYSSLGVAQIGTTVDNFSKYSSTLKQAMDDFYAGKIDVPDLSVTNYSNPALVTPDWASSLADPNQINEHVFGSLPNYGPSADARAAAKAMNTMAGTNYSPGKMKDDNVGRYSGGGTGTTFGGSPGQSGGGGYTPGGMNSPSGSGFGSPSSGSSFGGSNSPRGMGSPTSGSSSKSSFGGSNSPRGVGSSTSSTSSSKGGGYSTGASKGSTGGL